jgi:23S rRNA pseudouridine955/2504/2580 synthase
MPVFEYTIRFHQSGLQLANFLENQFTYYNSVAWSRELSEGKLSINGSLASGNEVLKMGDKICFLGPEFQEPEVDTNISILFEDEYFLVVSKSGDLPVHPAGRYKKNTLLEILKSQYNQDISIVHRLDRETSGIILVAKNPKSASRLHRLFSERHILKEYIVYIYGNFPDHFNACGWIGRDLQSKIRKKQIFSINQEPNFQETHTEFQILERFGNISKIIAKPITGKMHQIRASLHSLGFPVVGDKIYGLSEDIFLDFIQTGNAPNYPISRQALHAHKIEFQHPFTNEFHSFFAEEPEDMKSIHNL